MSAVIIAGAVIAAGAYLRWGLVPVWFAYELGKRVEKLRRKR